MNDPIYKTGEVVQLKGHYTNDWFAELPMIVLSVDGFRLDDYVYELLAGDIKILLYERCLELVK